MKALKLYFSEWICKSLNKNTIGISALSKTHFAICTIRAESLSIFNHHHLNGIFVFLLRFMWLVYMERKLC